MTSVSGAAATIRRAGPPPWLRHLSGVEHQRHEALLWRRQGPSGLLLPGPGPGQDLLDLLLLRALNRCQSSLTVCVCACVYTLPGCVQAAATAGRTFRCGSDGLQPPGAAGLHPAEGAALLHSEAGSSSAGQQTAQEVKPVSQSINLSVKLSVSR